VKTFAKFYYNCRIFLMLLEQVNHYQHINEGKGKKNEKKVQTAAFPDVIHILIRQSARFRISEQSAIGRAHRINADHIRPERRAVVRSRASSRRHPKSHIVWADSAEKHEDTGDDAS
jgi:hypothetical protein